MSGPLWTATEAAAATGGEAVGDWSVTGVSIDSRSIEAGDLFIALKVARDGHDFVAMALEAGAAAALVTHRPADVGEDAPLLIVRDVQKALEDLGRAGRARTKARVVAITGSVGKTSTKKMLADVLALQGKTHAAVKSFNNHWGVPLTLARMPVDVDYAVIEIGMSAPGEISPLAQQARPHVALITNVAPAHLEAFGAIEGIAEEKAAIFDGLEPEGTAIVNGDLETTDILVAAAKNKAAQLVTFGHRPVDDARIAELVQREGRMDVFAILHDHPVEFGIGLSGKHFALNAMAVLAAVEALGADAAAAAKALENWQPPGGRGQLKHLTIPGNGASIRFDLFDDAFNANPASMGASLEVMGDTTPPGGKAARRIAILGDMLELGASEMALHADLATHSAMAKIDVVHCVGPRMAALWHALDEEKRGHWAENIDGLLPAVSSLVREGDLVLVKGSKSSHVARAVVEFEELARRVPLSEKD